MPETYRSPHTGSIADLIGRRGMAGSRAIAAAGEGNAARTLASGQAWGNAIQNIGQSVSGTLADFARQREDAPNRELRQRQSDALAAELSQMETAAAQQRIGQLAQMVQASNYDPATAEPIFGAIAKLSPDYAEPLQRALMEPQALKQVTDLLITQVPGYKAPEGFSLSEGQTRFDASGQPIANVPKPEPVQQPFTLGEGQVRYNPDGTPVASGPAKPAPSVNLQRAEVLIDGRPAMAVFNPSTGTYSQNGVDVTARVRPIPPQGPAGGEPLESVIDPKTGQAVLLPRSQARGMRPATTREQPTEDERKSAGFYRQMSEAIAILDELEDQLTETELYQIQTLPQEELIGAINRGQMSEAAKRYLRAFEQFTEARMRPVSGAAISDSEFARDRRTYARQYAETPALATDRKNARRSALDSLKTRAMRALPEEAPSQVPDSVSALLKDKPADEYELSDGTVWVKDASGKITKKQ